MSKTKLRTGIVLAVVFVVFTVAAFAIPFRKTGVFWLSYVFGVVAIAAQIYVLQVAFTGQKSLRSKFYGFPIARVGVVYLVVQLVLSLVCMALAAILPIWIAILADVVVLGAAAVGFVATDAMREEIQRQDTVLKKDVSAMRAMQSMSRSLVSQCGDPMLRAELEKLSEALRYSDPVSSDALMEIEAELKGLLDEAQKAIVEQEYEAAGTLCRQAMGVLNERNRLCKLNK